MKYFQVKLKLRSALGTPLAADTLFGHLCWGIRYHQGESSLEQFLSEMKSGKPPLVFSDPFPAGFYPLPILPSFSSDHRDELLEAITRMNWHELKHIPETYHSSHTTGHPHRQQAHDILKVLLKRSWISAASLHQHQLSLSLAHLVKSQLTDTSSSPSEPTTFLSPHNRIDRLAGGTIEGGLFFTEDRFVPREGCDYDLYLTTNSYTAEEVEELLQHALEGGYGRDKNTGKGVIEVGTVTPWQPPACKTSNAVILLGPCAPTEQNPTEGYWDLFTKAGKLGGDWAIGPGPNGQHNPHKKPVTMLRRGSVLLTDSPQPFYGRILENVHPDFSEVVHYGIALAFSVQLTQAEVHT